MLLPSHLVDEVLPLSQQIKDNAEILETYLFNLSSVPTCIRRDTVEVSHVFFSLAILLVSCFELIPEQVGGQIVVTFSFLCLYLAMASSLLSFSANIVCRGSGTSSLSSSAIDFRSAFEVVVRVSKISAT